MKWLLRKIIHSLVQDRRWSEVLHTLWDEMRESFYEDNVMTRHAVIWEELNVCQDQELINMRKESDYYIQEYLR